MSGTIVKANCRVGQVVKPGDALFEIDQLPYRLELTKADAEVQRAESRKSRCVSQLERRRQQPADKLIGQAVIDEAAGELMEAKASLAVANADRELAQLKLDSTVVHSPIAGTVSGSVLDAGNVVAADTTSLATVHALDPVHVVFSVDQDVALKLKNQRRTHGGTSSPVVWVGSSREGRITRSAQLDLVDLRVIGRNQVQCRVLSNHDGVLFPGLAASVRVVAAEPHKALLVPVQSIGGSGNGGGFVYVLNGKNRELREVTSGLYHDGLIEVTTGLTADDWVCADYFANSLSTP